VTRPASSSPPADRSHGVAVAVVTLGCAKNEADSDVLGHALTAAGHTLSTPGDADVIVVNTCGFIDAAKEESIDALLDLAAVARERGARLVARGCLVAGYRAELESELPEVDLFMAFDDGPLLTLLDEVAADSTAAVRRAPRRRIRPASSYVKISDGCDHRCAFCAIPLLKGPYRAVDPRDVLATAERALEDGSLEIVLVGQDTSRWAWPGYGGLSRLLADLRRLGVPWVRLEYLQPDGIDDALLEAMGESALPYVDVPLQHADASVLRRMGRTGDAAAFADLLDRIRTRLPGAALRSTFLVGHPGETEAAFDELVAFVRHAALAVGGVFVFDPQTGTPAAAQADRVSRATAERRAAVLGAELESAAAAFWNGQVGTETDLLVEKGSRAAATEAIGRIPLQAPDVDGVTFLQGANARRRTIVPVRLTGVTGYDLHATAC